MFFFCQQNEKSNPKHAIILKKKWKCFIKSNDLSTLCDNFFSNLVSSYDLNIQDSAPLLTSLPHCSLIIFLYRLFVSFKSLIKYEISFHFVSFSGWHLSLRCYDNKQSPDIICAFSVFVESGNFSLQTDFTKLPCVYDFKIGIK